MAFRKISPNMLHSEILKFSQKFRKKKSFDFYSANTLLKQLFSFKNKEEHPKFLSYFEHEIKSLALMGIDEIFRTAINSATQDPCSAVLGSTGNAENDPAGITSTAISLTKIDTVVDASQLHSRGLFDENQLRFLLLILSPSNCICYNLAWNWNCPHWDQISKTTFLTLKRKWKYLGKIGKEVLKSDHCLLYWKVIHLLLKLKLYQKVDINVELLKNQFLENCHQKSVCLLSSCKVFIQSIKLDLENSIPVLISGFSQGITADAGEMRATLSFFAENLSAILQGVEKKQRSFVGSIPTFAKHLFGLLDQLLILKDPDDKLNWTSLQMLLQVVSIMYSSFSPKPRMIVDICRKLFQAIGAHFQTDDSNFVTPAFLKASASFMHRTLTDDTTICSIDFLPVLLHMNHCTSTEMFQSSPLNQSNSIFIMKCFHLVASNIERDQILSSLDDWASLIYITTTETMVNFVDDFVEQFGDGLLYSLSIAKVLLLHKKGRTAFGDSHFFTNIFSKMSVPERILKSISSKEQNTSLLLLECLHTASSDSSVRFKTKYPAISFFSTLFKECCKKTHLSIYEDRVLNLSTLFLNEFLGYDSEALEILTSNNFPSNIIHFLFRQVADQLDISSAALANMSSLRCLLSLAHLLDSILRTDNAKKWLIQHNDELEKLVQVALRAFSDISQVVNKILARILSDSSLTILLCNANTFYVVFNILMDPTNSSACKELLKGIETRFELCEEDIFPILNGVYEYSSVDHHSKFNALISLSIVSPVELLKGISGKATKMGRSLCRSILGTLIENYNDDMVCAIVIKYLATKTAGIFVESRRYVIDEETAALESVLASELNPSLLKTEEEMLSLIFPEDQSRTILLPKSWLLDECPPFKAMLEGSFAESRQRSVSLHDASDRCWEVVLIFISSKHTGSKCNSLVELSIPSKKTISLVADVLLLSQKFIIDSLKNAVLKWINTVCVMGAISRNPGLISHIYSCFLKSCQDETIASFQEVKHHIIQSFFIAIASG